MAARADPAELGRNTPTVAFQGGKLGALSCPLDGAVYQATAKTLSDPRCTSGATKWCSGPRGERKTGTRINGSRNGACAGNWNAPGFEGAGLAAATPVSEFPNPGCSALLVHGR